MREGDQEGMQAVPLLAKPCRQVKTGEGKGQQWSTNRWAGGLTLALALGAADGLGAWDGRAIDALAGRGAAAAAAGRASALGHKQRADRRNSRLELALGVEALVRPLGGG